MVCFIRILSVLLTFLLLGGPLGCGGDSSSDEGSQETTAGTDDEGSDDANVDGVDIPEPCPGLQQDKSAVDYNIECAGITECTQMPVNQISCFCAYCGPVGGKIECLQAQCPLPGG